MSLDAATLARALQAQHDDLLRHTLMTLCEDSGTVVAVVERTIRARQSAGASIDDLAPLSGVGMEMRAALRHLERALHALPPAP